MIQNAPKKDGPGVPEALPQSLETLRDRLGAERVDRLWLFPPIIRGRTERGLVVASCFPEADEASDADADRRLLHTLTYNAERTGKALTIDAELFEEGMTPEDRVSRVIRGVVRRSEVELGDPRDVELGGDAETFSALIEELTPEPMEGMPA